MKRYQLMLGLTLAVIAPWLLLTEWVGDAGNGDGTLTGSELEGNLSSPVEFGSPEHGAMADVGGGEGSMRLEGAPSHTEGNPPDPDLPWWENEILSEAYNREFAIALADAKRSDAISGLEESLDELRAIEPETLEAWGLSGVDWAALGELSKSYQVQAVLFSVRTLRDVDLEEMSYEKQRFYINEEPFLVSPEGLLTLLAERTITLDPDQLRELEGIYWGALGQRARAEDHMKFARSADRRARQLVGERYAGVRTLPSLPAGSDDLPAELSQAVAIKSEVNDAYTSQLLFFLRRNGF
ncbi:MAG: hypothetical protein CMJ94_04510 [Planctomycetes bacterium]|nr:hypothetical protein [Planctomycetota bacterium]